MAETEAIPLTTNTIAFVGSDHQAPFRIYRQPTKEMVLVVEGSWEVFKNERNPN